MQWVFAVLHCRPGLNGAVVPADAAQPLMKETISSIQNKIDHLYNRTQVSGLHPLREMTSTAPTPFYILYMGICTLKVHDQTLLNINNHLVNGGGNELDRGPRGGGNQMTTLKEEILTELERRVSLSCSACQVRNTLADVPRQKETPLVPFVEATVRYCFVLSMTHNYRQSFHLAVCVVKASLSEGRKTHCCSPKWSKNPISFKIISKSRMTVV